MTVVMRELFNRGTKDPKSPAKFVRRPLTEYDIIQRTLLCKGREATPSSICMNVNGRWKTNDIASVMQSLSDQGVGTFLSRTAYSGSKKVFLKKHPSEISTDFLALYKIPLHLYAQRYETVLTKEMTKSTPLNYPI
jgi:hypothetical protein